MTPDSSQNVEAIVAHVAQTRTALLSELHKVIIGQDEMLQQMLIAIFARGHCLTIGVPGLAKTLTISTLAQAISLNFRRIQFTPDLMPSDITGTQIIDQDHATGQRSFRFVPGPIFSNIVLADEINRTPPKTQAALLQAMQEYEVTSAGQTYTLEKPFFVMATQNPIEQEGTYPLPEAQLDRFMLSIWIGYPTRDEERQIVMATTAGAAQRVRAVLGAKEILQIQQLVRQMPATPHVVDYAVDLVRATRPKEPDSPKFIQNWLAWGAGPRAAQNIILTAKARALLHGRFAVTADDIRAMTIPVLRHRIFTNFNADAEGIDVVGVIEQLLRTVPEPSYGEPVAVRGASIPVAAPSQPTPPHKPTAHKPASGSTIAAPVTESPATPVAAEPSSRESRVAAARATRTQPPAPSPAPSAPQPAPAAPNPPTPAQAPMAHVAPPTVPAPAAPVPPVVQPAPTPQPGAPSPNPLSFLTSPSDPPASPVAPPQKMPWEK